MTPRSPSIGSSLPIEAAARRIMLKVPIRLTRITRSKSASGWGPSRPATRLATPMPAQLTSTRAGPCAASALAIPAPAEASSATSPTTPRPPAALAASAAAAGLRSKTATRAPLAASASAVARPNPEPPPVTIAATPVSFIALPPSAPASPSLPHLAARRFAPRSADLQEQPAPFDLHRISRKIHTGRRALRFAGGEVEPAVMHRTFDDRALDIAVGESRLFVGANAVGGEVAAIRRSIERILPAFVLERRDVLGRYAVGGSSVDPAFAHLPMILNSSPSRASGRRGPRPRRRRQLAVEVGNLSATRRLLNIQVSSHFFGMIIPHLIIFGMFVTQVTDARRPPQANLCYLFGTIWPRDPRRPERAIAAQNRWEEPD